MVLYAPAVCPDCGNVFRSDLLIAEAPWIIASYRLVGGACPRCGGRGVVPPWVYRLHDLAAQSRDDATDRETRALTTNLGQLLRRHRTAKQTLAFVNDLRGPWKPLVQLLKAGPPQQRRAQLLFLLWTLTESEKAHPKDAKEARIYQFLTRSDPSARPIQDDTVEDPRARPALSASAEAVRPAGPHPRDGRSTDR